MQLRLGDTVYSADGQEVGKIKHLVLDPQTAEA
jgi:sporulation protein YlmC with PRC-barrel domain